MKEEICQICGELKSSKTIGKVQAWDDLGNFITDYYCTHGLHSHEISKAKEALEAAVRAVQKKVAPKKTV